MTRLLTLAVLLSAFFFTLSSGTYCIGEADSIKKSQQCAGGAGDCQYGTYCDDAGICSPLLDIGTACLYDSDCVHGAYCQGKNGEKICVGVAGIGETCSRADDETKARCADNSDCHLVEEVCVGGRLGDTCKKVSGINVCNGELTCTDGVCTGVVEGGNCTSTSDCLPNLFCNYESPRVCQQRKVAGGGECDDHRDCVPGSYCMGPSDSSCVAEKSIKVGEFCDGIDAVCESLRCGSNDFCASGSPMFTDSNYVCSEREVATCGGLIQDYGVYTCTPNPCYDLEKAFGDCIQKNCQQCENARCTDYSIDKTPGRCYANHCDKEFTNMRACNGAGQLVGSVFVAAFVALIASFVSKKF